MLDSKAETGTTLRTPLWYTTATRWTQLTLAEDDPVKFDPAQWIDIFRRTHSNATCLSAGGYIAYYPSQVSLHYVSKFLGDSDPFGTLVNGARNLGMHVMARVDPHAIHQDAADAHPEWIAVDKDGQPRRHWAFPEVWVTCAYGDYNAKFMPQVVEEITRLYDIDAIFANRWQGHGVCYCETCKSRFRAGSGLELPRRSDAADPAWQAWVLWRRNVLTELIVQWDEVVKSVRPHASFIPNMGSASLQEFDLSIIEKHCPFLVVDHQARQGVEVAWSAGRAGKRMRAGFPDRPAVLITSVGLEENRWKDSVQTGDEIQLWVDDGTVQGMAAWFTKFNGVIPDTRWIEPMADAFGRHADIADAFAATKATAEIALIDPATTHRLWPRDEHARAEVHDLGVYHALVEARLPFEMISDQRLTVENLSRFKLVILPNAACLSDTQCAALRGYVENGGSLVAAYETSLRDETGRSRPDFALADVFGVRLREPARGVVKNTYVALGKPHPINYGYDGANRIVGGTYLLGVEAQPGTETPFLYVPDFPDLPMEEVYPREEPRGAAVVARETGKGGRVVYVPWNIGEVFWHSLARDHGRLIENAISWALGKPADVGVTGDGVIDLAVRSAPDQTIVALLNLTNPMMMKGPLRGVYPIGPQTISVVAPKGATRGEARLLIGGDSLPVIRREGRFEVVVPGVTRMEVVQIEWR
ncbi:MAG: beta-galactosidase trimerization domain-containing protein [Devosia sp.]|nr:beta-galactosidase trimerization domain-containing protein [Devosia sp.]